MKRIFFKKQDWLLAFVSLLLPVILVSYVIYAVDILTQAINAALLSDLTKEGGVTRFDFSGLEKALKGKAEIPK